MSTPSPDISDEQILELLASPKTNEKGFRHLMEKYQERLYWHIRRLVTDHEDANDVLQNCFIKIYRNIRGFKRNAKLYTWMYRIATNESITFLKKKNRRTAASLDNGDSSLADQLEADPYFNGDETQRRLQEALRELPEKQRVVFNLRYFEEMSYREISEILGTSEGGLKASYHHAVKKIEYYFRRVEIQ